MIRRALWAILIFICMLVSNSVHAIDLHFSPETKSILNPERGWYLFRPLTSKSDFASVRALGATIVYSELDLSPFKSAAIPTDRLADLEGAFRSIRSSGIKAIVRIVYAHSVEEEDASILWIKNHLVQLSELFERNKDVIYLFQAGCIGAWGEWHSSHHGLDTLEGENQVLALLSRYLPSTAQIALRKLSFKQNFLETLSRSKQVEEGSRLGHHNDCFLSDMTDSGTYPENEIERWKSKISEESSVVAVGGETCRVNYPRSGCDQALNELQRLGFSYLNRDYHPEVVSAWRTGSCFDQISDLLGYRFELLGGHISIVNNMVRGDVTIRNAGWAPLYSKRNVYLLIINGSGKVVLQAPLSSINPKTWLPRGKESYQLKFSVEVPATVAADSLVTVALWIPDPDERLNKDPRYAIRFANLDTWDEVGGYTVLTRKFSLR